MCGCLVAGVQTLPVHAGEICAPVLGVAIEAWDDKGRSVVDQEANMVSLKSRRCVSSTLTDGSAGIHETDTQFASWIVGRRGQQALSLDLL